MTFLDDELFSIPRALFLVSEQLLQQHAFPCSLQESEDPVKLREAKFYLFVL